MHYEANTLDTLCMRLYIEGVNGTVSLKSLFHLTPPICLQLPETGAAAPLSAVVGLQPKREWVLPSQAEATKGATTTVTGKH